MLAEVVKAERPDLERSKQQLTMQQNHFKITLKSLEDELLARLAAAGDNVLEDPSLVVNLEDTKKTAAEIEEKVCETRKTTSEIDAAREIYRCVAERASILYFILNDLCKINLMYQFSLKAFIVVFKRAINQTERKCSTDDRVAALLDSITYAVYLYTCRGLFEKDKLVYKMHLAFQILVHDNQVSAAELDFILRFPYTPNLHSPFDFLPSHLWGGVKALSNIDHFYGLERDLDQSTKRWKKFVESEAPEMELEKLPGEWKNKTQMQKLCIIRTLRPDRMVYAAACFVEETMGEKYVGVGTIPFVASFHESCASTPIFFILSPGDDDPLQDVEKLGKSMTISPDHDNFHNISLGQGQERLAEAAIDIAIQHGHWVVLQNIHLGIISKVRLFNLTDVKLLNIRLVTKWLPHLEKIIEETLESVHPDFRLFVSAEAAPSPDIHAIPQGILEASIKITNESPTGIKANLHRALDNFTQEMLVRINEQARTTCVGPSLQHKQKKTYQVAEGDWLADTFIRFIMYNLAT